MTKPALGLAAVLSAGAAVLGVSFAATTRAAPHADAAAQPTATPTGKPTPTRSSATCSRAQLLGNPGFETGEAAPWTATDAVIYDSTGMQPRSGNWDAWLGGYPYPATDTLSQQVTVPAGCKAGLSFWPHVASCEPSTGADTLTVKANSTTLATYTNRDATDGYVHKTLDLSPSQARR
ncbi:hypothetical protein [Kitasatospora sp. NPDC056531]|uniref:hypothetical protein n=1 Tax=Kitasatospora sp. NPDC056531 TaxID=3345856 RepID=UPI0036B61294